MVDNINKKTQVELHALRQYYIAILNCMPYLVYWIDENCLLQGCNTHFAQLLDLKNVHDFSGEPYDRIAKATSWSAETLEAFKLDDMAVIFSGQAKHKQVIPPILQADASLRHYMCNRDPILDNTGRIIGAVVVMIETDGLPRHEQQPIEITGLHNARAVSSSLKKIPRVLIVEDNMVAKNVEAALLVALKCQVDTAATGQQALILFEPGKYDLVVMDIGLEDTSGYVLSKQFRQMEKNSNFHVPIIALTSFQADLVKYDCDYYFMDGVISKPLTSEQANQMVEHYVYHKTTTVTGLKHV